MQRRQLNKKQGQLNTTIKKFSIEPDRKLGWLKVIIALALCSGFVLSRKLWISSRLYPLAPVSDFLPTIPFPLDYAWFLSLIGLSLAIVIIAQPRMLTLAFLALAGVLSFFDQTRWQPWFYQYFFMLAALGFYAWRKPETKNNSMALNTCRLIVICTYLWSGLQKLNINFVRETWPDMSEPLHRFFSLDARNTPAFLVLIIPLLEILLGLGLITRKYRNASVILALVIHLFILALLIISGENTVVWPWNVAMVLFVVVLFWQDTETGPKMILIPRDAFQKLVLILFGVLPAFSFIDLWDSYLSSALYSGNTDQAIIYVSQSVIDLLPAEIHPHIWQSSEPMFLDINRWAYGELNVPVYPEPRVYRKITERICEYAGSSPDIKLRIKEKPGPLTGKRESKYYDCDHLSILKTAASTFENVRELAACR